MRLLTKFLDFVEKVGNRLPHPATLFAVLAVLVVVLSWILSELEVVAVHPGTGEAIRAVNLLSVEGLHRIVLGVVPNFTGFVPLGTVLVAMLGVGVAERSGLLGAVLRALVMKAPRKWITWVVVFTGVLSNLASEAGYVILIPLAAVVFEACGRHPLAGLAAAFAGVSGGYSANLALGTVDPLLAGLSTEAARLLVPGYTVSPAANYYFMAASTLVVTACCVLVTEKLVEPRLGAHAGGEAAVQGLNDLEKKGLLAAFVAVLVLLVLVVAALVPENGWLRNARTGGLLDSPFLGGIVVFIFLFFLIPGLAYGIRTGTMRRDADVIEAMGKTLSTLGPYIVLVFFAAQFVAFFNWTRLGTIVAIEGATMLKAAGFTGAGLLVAFVMCSAFLNLFMGSASAKWAVLAPVFVPMFMLLGYTPELTQAAYRVGDSCTNVISPMMSYFALIVAFAQRYDREAGLGTIVSMMLPYAVTLLICWGGLLVLWVQLGLPLGPGAGTRLG